MPPSVCNPVSLSLLIAVAILQYTVFLLKIRHENNNIALASPNFVNIHHSVCVRIPFPFIAYTHVDLCRKIRGYIQSFGKGCRIIRRAEFLEEIR